MIKQNELPKRIGQIMIFALILLSLFTNLTIAKSAPKPGGIVTDAYGNKYDLYNINGVPGVYATNPGEVKSIQNILNGIGQMSSTKAINNYIKKYSPKSPITADMIINAVNQYPSVSCPIMMAMMRQDSNFADPRINWLGKVSPNGPRQRAYRYHNPGNVGNTDSGANVDWGTWQAGVNAVAKNLAQRKVSTSTPTLTVSPTSGNQGTTFTFSGNGYTQNGNIEWHVKRPDNSEITPSTFTASSSGALSKSYTSSTADMAGNYTFWAVDKTKVKQSNSVQVTITAVPITLQVSPTSGIQGTTFTFTGKGFTPYSKGGQTAYHYKVPINPYGSSGTYYSGLMNIADSSGNIRFTFPTSSSVQAGT